MHGYDLPVVNAEEFLRVAKALGSHRYLDGSLHLVHAFALEAAGPREQLEGAYAWAIETLGTPDIDPNSRDPRLYRTCTNAELVAVLAGFFSAGAERARERLQARLATVDATTPSLPFDESAESDMFPLLVDAGWQLLPLAALDPERHKGAILAFGEPIAFETARFDEENTLPTQVTLQELPAMGAAELLSATDSDGDFRRPIPLYSEGNEVYLDYVMRGVLRAAKLEEA